MVLGRGEGITSFCGGWCCTRLAGVDGMWEYDAPAGVEVREDEDNFGCRSKKKKNIVIGAEGVGLVRYG